MADTDKLVKVGQLDAVADAVIEVVSDTNERLEQYEKSTGIIPLSMERGGLNFVADNTPTASNYNADWRARTPLSSPATLPAGAYVIPNVGYKLVCITYDGTTYGTSGWIRSLSSYGIKNHYELPADSVCWIMMAAEVESGDSIDVKTLSDNLEIYIPESQNAKIQKLESDSAEASDDLRGLQTEVGIVPTVWEMGFLNMTVGEEEPTESPYGATFRLRTPVGSPIAVRIGNTVSVETGYQFLIGYNAGEGLVVTEWMTGTWVSPADGDMWIVVRKYGEDQSPIPYDILKDTVVIRKDSDTCLVDRVSYLETQYSAERLPDYYYADNWYPNKLEEVKTASKILNGVVFPFVTDLHLVYNSGYSKYMIRDLFEKTSCSFCLSGGDFQAGYGGENELTEMFNRYFDYIGVIGHDRWFPVVGNHDFYCMAHEGDSRDTWVKAPWSRVYNAVIRPSERWQIDNQKGGYYCLDIPAQKTRIIMLNTSEQSPPTADTLTDGLIRTRPDQIRWMVSKIKEVSDYHIIVVSHVPSDPEMTSYIGAMDFVQQVLEGFAQKTTVQLHFSSSWTWEADFTENTNELVCHINGHAHVDESHMNNGVLSISTTCDACFRDDGHEAVRGTVTEQAFDVFCVDYDKRTIKAVRLGRGQSREWNYAVE